MSWGLTTGRVSLWKPRAHPTLCTRSATSDAQAFVFEETPGMVVGRPNLISGIWHTDMVDDAQWLYPALFPAEV
jgi:hypothetical protein